MNHLEPLTDAEIHDLARRTVTNEIFLDIIHTEVIPTGMFEGRRAFWPILALTDVDAMPENASMMVWVPFSVALESSMVDGKPFIVRGVNFVPIESAPEVLDRISELRELLKGPSAA